MSAKYWGVLATVLLASTLFVNSAAAYSVESQNSAGKPHLFSTSWNYVPSTQSVSCNLPNVQPNDLLVVDVQSSGYAQHYMTASDNASDTFAYAEFWPQGVGWAYTQTSGSGVVTITVTVSVYGAGLAMFCYNIGGVTTTVAISQAVNGTGTKISVPSFTMHKSSFIIGYVMSGPNPPTFAAGKGFTLTPGTPIEGQANNYVANEYLASSSSSSTCPMKIAYDQEWFSVCLAFAPS